MKEKTKKPSNYISIKESRKIIKYNIKQMKYYEALKKQHRNVKEYTSVMKDENNLIEIENLKTCFFTDNGTVMSVNGVSFDIPKNKIVGVVGESGCGKSVTSLSIMQLVQSPQGQVVDGEIRFNNNDLGYDENHQKLAYDITKMPTKEMYKIRGKDITMIFQEPMTSLNPIITIGKQITSIIIKHQGCTENEARKRAIELMYKVGIPKPEARFDDYPFQYSGGMRQRIVIAIALSCQPKILICDEPTTALDVTIQAQILQLLKDLQKEFKFTIVFITHDLGVVANIADRVAVLYGGQIVELGNVEEVFYDPRHPYTWALLSSLPQLAQRNTELFSITGTPPSLYNEIVGDAFAPRNPYCLKVDTLKEPPMFKVTDTHYAKTWLLDPRAPKINKPEAIEDIHGKLLKAFNI